jgi:hypothetical protein
MKRKYVFGNVFSLFSYMLNSLIVFPNINLLVSLERRWNIKPHGFRWVLSVWIALFDLNVFSVKQKYLNLILFSFLYF